MSDGIVMTREFQRGRVVLASPAAMKRAVLDATQIAVWGSRAVSCCVISNGLPPTQVGVSRRSVVKSSHLVVSETLVAVRDSPLKTFVTYSLTDQTLQAGAASGRKSTETLRAEQAAMLAEASVSGERPRLLAAAQRGAEEVESAARRRAAPHPSDAVPGALYMDTTVTVSPVDSDPEKCFVEMFVEFAASTAQRLDDVHFFLEKSWIGPLLDSLADHALSISFPIVKGPTDLQFRKLYERHEDTVVRLCAKKHIDDELKQRTEALLDALYASYRDTVAAQAQASHMKEELHSSQILLRDANSRIAAMQAEMLQLQSKLLLLEHAGDNSSANEAAAQENDDRSPQRALPQTSQSQQATVDTSSVSVQTAASKAGAPAASAASAQRGGVSERQAQQFVLTPEMRSRQVVSAIDEFSVQREHQTRGISPAVAAYNQLAHPPVVWGRNASDERLRAKFAALDADQLGYLTVDQLASVLAALEPLDDFDVQQRLERERQMTPRGGARSRAATAGAVKAELDKQNPRTAIHYRSALEFVQRYCKDKNKVGFDEFCVFILKLERAL